jgi:ADP-heptose:LPS heptosyltransferase
MQFKVGACKVRVMWTPGLLKYIDPAVWFIGVVIGALVAMRPPKRSASDRVALIRPGGLGDLVLLTMAIEDMSLPMGFFRFFIETRSVAWAKQLKLDYVVIDRGLIRALWVHRGRYKTVINTEQFFGTSQAFARAIRAPKGKTFGFATLRAAKFLDAAISYDPRTTHEVDEFTKLLKKSLPSHTRPLFSHHRERFKPAADYIAIAVSGLGFPSRYFTVERWLDIIKDQPMNRCVKILAAPSERAFAQALGTTLRHRLAIKVDIVQGAFHEVLRALQQAELLIGIEGGMTQMASYYGVPTVSIFTSSQDKKWAPLSVGSSVLRRRDLHCQPCAKFAQVPICKYQYACKNTKHFILTPLSGKSGSIRE